MYFIFIFCMCQAGKQMLCNGVSTSVVAQTFTTPPSHRSISAENNFHNIHSVSIMFVSICLWCPNINSISLNNAKHPIWSLSCPHQVFNVASLPISESSGMKSDESGFSESMHLSYTSAKTQSYSTASTQTPPELNLPEDDLQIGDTHSLRFFLSHTLSDC